MGSIACAIVVYYVVPIACPFICLIIAIWAIKSGD